MTRARDLSNLIGSGNYTSTTFTATAGQTVFTIAHTQGFIQVFMNGLLLDETTDYTSNGTAVTLTEAATAGDELEVVKYNTFSVGDAITQTDADTRYVNASGDTMTGGLNVTGGNLGIGTTSPLGPLHIEGNTNTYATAPVVYFGSTSTASSAIRDWAIGPADNNYGNFHIFRGVATGTNAVGSQEIVVTIDSSGRVTMPYQPAFSEPAYTNYSTSTVSGDVYMTSSNVFANVTAGTQTNVGNHWNASTGRFTAPVAGYYQFILNVATIYSSGYFYVYLKKNGSTMAYAPMKQSSDWEHRTLSTIIHMNANDYMQGFFTKNYTGGNIGHCHFSGRLIG